MDFGNQLFRCHRAGTLMTEPRSKSEGPLSVTTKTYLRELNREIKYNRKKEFTNKYVQKGLMVEEDSITLYSRLYKRYFKKNTDRIENDFLSGEPDLFEGESIRKATHVIDAKSSWDLFTFPYPGDKVDKNYYWQMQGYMALTGAKKGTVVFCLIDTPLILIEDAKRILMYKMGVATTENSDYIEACEKIEKSMTFSDIPMKERVIEFVVERNDDDIQKLYDRIELCRDYLNSLESPSAMIAEHKPELSATIIEPLTLSKI